MALRPSVTVAAVIERGGKFLLSYEDSDEQLNNEAMLVRDREIKEGRMSIDPITGKPRPHIESGENQAGKDEEKSSDDKQN